MERVVQLAGHFKVPAMVCANKFDLNSGQIEAIEKLAEERNMMVLGRIPFDPILRNR
jgi:MinD superfamily P-loop ATPase